MPNDINQHLCGVDGIEIRKGSPKHKSHIKDTGIGPQNSQKTLFKFLAENKKVNPTQEV